ncbi:PemK-like protein (fragment) [Rhizobium sp. EC-SD404]
MPAEQFFVRSEFFRVAVEPTIENGLRLPSEIMVDKIQSANRSRIGEAIGRMDDDTMNHLARSLTIVLGLVDL